MRDAPKWLLLVFTLPTSKASERVQIWRKLQRFGSIPFRNAGSLLPNTPDNQERFDPLRIRLADIDGTGSADLLYIGHDGVRAWFNQSGNAWSAPTSIAVFPTADTLGSVRVP